MKPAPPLSLCQPTHLTSFKLGYLPSLPHATCVLISLFFLRHLPLSGVTSSPSSANLISTGSSTPKFILLISKISFLIFPALGDLSYCKNLIPLVSFITPSSMFLLSMCLCARHDTRQCAVETMKTWSLGGSTSSSGEMGDTDRLEHDLECTVIAAPAGGGAHVFGFICPEPPLFWGQ